MLKMGLQTYLLDGPAEVGPTELKIKSSILTRRGGCVANAPRSPRKLCCDIDILDL